MPEPTGPRIRPKRLARQMLDQELKAAERQNGARQGAAPPRRQRASLGQAMDDTVDEMARLLRGVLRRLLRGRQPDGADGGGQEHQQAAPAPGPEAQQTAPGPGFAPHQQHGALEPPSPSPQQERRRLKKHQPGGVASPWDVYDSLADGSQQQAAVQDAVRKLLDSRTRYSTRRDMLPYSDSLASVAGKRGNDEAKAKAEKRAEKKAEKAERKAEKKAGNTQVRTSARSWLSRLVPSRAAKPGPAKGRSAESGSAGARPATPDSALVPGARMNAPPGLPQLPEYASGRVAGPRTAEHAVAQALSSVVAPPQEGLGRHPSTQLVSLPLRGSEPPPVPPKAPLSSPAARQSLEHPRSSSAAPGENSPTHRPQSPHQAPVSRRRGPSMGR